MKKGTRISTKVIKELLLDGVWYDLKGMTEPDDGVSGTSLSIENPKKKSDDEKRIVYREKNFYQRNILGEWSKNKWVKEDDRAPGGYDMDEEGYRALAIFTGDIHGLDSYTLINEEKEQREKEERNQRRIELMKTLLDTKDDSQNTD